MINKKLKNNALRYYCLKPVYSKFIDIIKFHSDEFSYYKF